MIVERNIKENYSFFVKSYLYCNNIYMMLVENFISFFQNVLLYHYSYYITLQYYVTIYFIFL